MIILIYIFTILLFAYLVFTELRRLCHQDDALVGLPLNDYLGEPNSSFYKAMSSTKFLMNCLSQIVISPTEFPPNFLLHKECLPTELLLIKRLSK